MISFLIFCVAIFGGVYCVEKKKVYCSGPLFNGPEKAEMKQIATILESNGFSTYLPQRDGFEAYMNEFDKLEKSAPQGGIFKKFAIVLSRVIFSVDVYHLIEESDYVVVNMNGRVVDEGSCVEAGIAWTTGKPVVLYRDDDRGEFAGDVNGMLIGLSTSNEVSDIGKIPEVLESTVKEFEKENPDMDPKTSFLKGNLPKSIRNSMKIGKAVSELLVIFRNLTSDESKMEIVERIVDLF